jgi:aminopeptidase-like protein
MQASPDEYEVVIDSTLKDRLLHGECVLPGQSDEEFLISTHVCHPSLANDNLSGLAVAATLAKVLAPIPRRYTYRFLFVPGTIGAISWLFRNRAGGADQAWPRPRGDRAA